MIDDDTKVTLLKHYYSVGASAAEALTRITKLEGKGCVGKAFVDAAYKQFKDDGLAAGAPDPKEKKPELESVDFSEEERGNYLSL